MWLIKTDNFFLPYKKVITGNETFKPIFFLHRAWSYFRAICLDHLIRCFEGKSGLCQAKVITIFSYMYSFILPLKDPVVHYCSLKDPTVHYCSLRGWWWACVCTHLYMLLSQCCPKKRWASWRIWLSVMWEVRWPCLTPGPGRYAVDPRSRRWPQVTPMTPDTVIELVLILLPILDLTLD